jgi:plastocyanin
VKRAIAGLATVAVAASVSAAVPSLGAGTTKTIAVKDNYFGPSKVTIAKGTTLKWVWKGKTRHNVSVATGPTSFRAGTRKTGTFSHTFKKAGSYFVVCTIHAPDMHMTIKVK